MLTVRSAALAAACVAALSSITPAQAYELLGGLGGPTGYGEEFLAPNDDGFVGPLALPFSINFFGSEFSRQNANNNGSISFRSGLSSYTPSPFPVSNQPMLAPYWADVDTRGAGIVNKLWYASPNSNTLAVTWEEVGYFGAHTDKTNSFQLILTKRDDVGGFDVEYRYQQLQWTTGDASGGAGGLGGTPAQAGWDAGDGINFQTLPGSFTVDVLDLVNTSNVSADTPGLWRFSFANGVLPGRSEDNPLLPTFTGSDTEPGWQFQFEVPDTETRLFIDPLIAVGYEYELDTAGVFFTSVLLPFIGDGLYGIEVWSGSEWLARGEAVAGNVFAFGADVSRFRVVGIEQEAGLDPDDTQAFVTGLTFSAPGRISMSQTPIVVPEPASILMALGGLAVVGALGRRRRSA
jgi:uncharacterized protein (TIGR03382 family)